MKHRILLSAALLIALVAAAPTFAMDKDELVAKSIEAQGGADKLQAVKSMTATGKAMAQGMEFPFNMRQVRPNLMRLDIDVMGMKMVQAYDGTQGWTINPMTGSQDAQPMGELENKSFKLQSDMDGLLLGADRKGYEVTFVGEADVEGTPAYQLKIDTGEGIVIDMFIDQEYFLTIKQSATIDWDGKVVSQDTYMSDFQEVNGMVIPFSIETRMGAQVVSQIVLDTVEHDTEIDPSIFAMPAAAPAAPATPEGQ
ncbi:hypothetical protein KDM41_14990 [bacterium]|nr:hypothetical protein [bacterium]